MAPQKWEQTLSRQIRDNHGNGWNVIAQSGKCKLTRRYEDGTKSAKVLPIEWKATNSVQILNAVTRVRELVETRNVSVAEAVRLDTEALAVPEEHNGTADQGWPAVVEEYLATKEGRRSSTLADLRTRLNRVLVCMDNRPKPRDSRALLKRFAELHFIDGVRQVAKAGNGTVVKSGLPDLRRHQGRCTAQRWLQLQTVHLG